ncbi:MAG: hypothetical protein NTY49_01280 [Polynucleobacter sp.]|nr:hypothetical protein [Polynucleobacter sp.]
MTRYKLHSERYWYHHPNGGVVITTLGINQAQLSQVYTLNLIG